MYFLTLRKALIFPRFIRHFIGNFKDRAYDSIEPVLKDSINLSNTSILRKTIEGY